MLQCRHCVRSSGNAGHAENIPKDLASADYGSVGFCHYRIIILSKLYPYYGRESIFGSYGGSSVCFLFIFFVPFFFFFALR